MSRRTLRGGGSTGTPLASGAPAYAAGAWTAGMLTYNFGIVWRCTTDHTGTSSMDVSKFTALNVDTRAAELRPNRHRLPSTLQLRGGNIVPKAAHTPTFATDPNRVGVWASFYNEWDWNGWIKFQVDLAISAGANAIRLIGDIYGIKAGTYTTTAYLAKWQQLIEYCQSKGVYVYGCVAAAGHMNSSTQAEMVALASAYGALCEPYDNVIGIDIVQEYDFDASVTAANINAMSAALRAVTNIPLTCSVSTEGALTSARITALDGAVDFYDAHLYAAVAPSAFQTAYPYTSKPLMIGEAGGNESVSATKLAVYQTVGREIATRDNVLGCFSWAIVDQQTETSGQWGMFTAAGVERTAYTSLFKKWSTTRANGRQRQAYISVTSDFTVPSAVGWNQLGSTLNVALPVDSWVRVHYNLDFTAPAATDLYSAGVTLNSNGATTESNPPGTDAAGGTTFQGVAASTTRETWSGLRADTLMPAGVVAVKLYVGHASGSSGAGVVNKWNSGATVLIRPAY